MILKSHNRSVRALMDFGIFVAVYFLVAWLVEGSAWLHALLAFLVVKLTGIETNLSEIKELRSFIEISDAQVVRLSGDLERLKDKEFDWDEGIQALNFRVDDLETDLRSRTDAYD